MGVRGRLKVVKNINVFAKLGGRTRLCIVLAVIAVQIISRVFGIYNYIIKIGLYSYFVADWLAPRHHCLEWR